MILWLIKLIYKFYPSHPFKAISRISRIFAWMKHWASYYMWLWLISTITTNFTLYKIIINFTTKTLQTYNHWSQKSNSNIYLLYYWYILITFVAVSLCKAYVIKFLVVSIKITSNLRIKFINFKWNLIDLEMPRSNSRGLLDDEKLTNTTAITKPQKKGGINN